MLDYKQRTTSESERDDIWVQGDPKDLLNGESAGQDSRSFWLEGTVLRVLPWLIVAGFAGLGVLAFLGLIKFY